jgi:iron complex transport system ATP-binding protein
VHAAIKVDAVDFSYNARNVIRGISFSVGEGEVAGVIGKNGSGKTTLLRLIAGWLAPAGGVIEVKGKRVKDMAARERARIIAVLSQTWESAFDLKARDVVLLGRAPYLGRFEETRPIDLDTARWAMEMTDTWELRERPVSLLSAGERQRVMISRVLAQEAPVLLLDEPTSGLDIAHQKMVMNNLSWLVKAKRTAVVLVSHDVNMAGRYADRLLMMADGKKTAWGTCPGVITAENLRETYGLDLVVEERQGRKIVLEWEDGGRRATWEA